VSISVILISGSFTPGHASKLNLKYTSGKLTADVSKASLQNVLKALSEKCDIKVFLDESIKQKRISTRFSNLPLEKAIARLVKPYGSVLVFGRKKASEGKTEFYVKEVKIYDSSKKKSSYIKVGGKGSPSKERAFSQRSTAGEQRRMNGGRHEMAPIPNVLRDPIKAAAYKKEISSKMLQTRMTKKISELQQLQRRMRYDEEKKRHKLMQLQNELKTASESDAKQIQSELSFLSADLKNSSQRNGAELKRLQTQLEQMKHTFVDQKS
jgi:hypothetical protein